KFRREYEARRAAREAWLASVDASLAAQKKGSRGDPTSPSPGAFDRAAGVSGGLAGSGGGTCQSCVEGCGSIARCGGDEFVGGRCGHLRGGDGFDTCVAECTARADACVKACGDCGEAAPPVMKGGR
ncbi:MAG: hypothetical protein JWP97_219, partial [Labilithrix sp.]|nr:hypothetical protein [Labilithrix sp.]